MKKSSGENWGTSVFLSCFFDLQGEGEWPYLLRYGVVSDTFFDDLHIFPLFWLLQPLNINTVILISIRDTFFCFDLDRFNCQGFLRAVELVMGIIGAERSQRETSSTPSFRFCFCFSSLWFCLIYIFLDGWGWVEWVSLNFQMLKFMILFHLIFFVVGYWWFSF